MQEIIESTRQAAHEAAAVFIEHHPREGEHAARVAAAALGMLEAASELLHALVGTTEVSEVRRAVR